MHSYMDSICRKVMKDYEMKKGKHSNETDFSHR